MCYVYIDDVIIVSESNEEHVAHVNRVLKKLCDVGMRLSQNTWDSFFLGAE